MYRSGKISFIAMLPVLRLNDYMGGDQFEEVVHDHSCSYLVADILRFF